MCETDECRQVSTTAESMTFKEITKQIEKCQRCCHEKETTRQKDETYLKVRLSYMDKFFHEKNAAPTPFIIVS